ncbi:hypothetical protein [Cellvibrio sp. NN19]|uniref:hypothetical protein n=1 Tax=Cellvibrio chitinivorans TaxID=3102792 RepID=UPI002B40C590|nr:hypothetical protein [Cellvibrio sp. NN19]
MYVSATQHSSLKSLHVTQSNAIANQSSLNIATTISGDDTVTLSAEGQRLAATMTKSGVEQYALPSWFGEFSPAFSNLGSGERVEEGRKFVAMSEKLGTDGELSLKDQNAIQSYLNNISVTAERKQVEAQYYNNKALYEEYSTIHANHFKDALAAQGIDTQDDWNEKVINAPGNNQELRMNIMEKMLNDPRAVELMSILGIKKPVV